MNRVEFMGQLERLLGDIPENDRLDAITYYNNYFDEAGAENEAQVIRELGSPGKVAAIIKADLGSSGSERTEYTAPEYGDAAGHANQQAPSRRETGYHEPKKKRNIPLALIIVLLVFASPVLVGVGGGLLGAVVGILGALFGIIVAVIACGLAFLVAGVVCIAAGIVRVVFSPAEGLITIGVGSILLALGILFLIVLVWCVFKWLPAIFRGCVNLCQKLFRRGERRNKA